MNSERHVWGSKKCVSSAGFYWFLTVALALVPVSGQAQTVSATVPGTGGDAVAVDAVTNKIYVLGGQATVIDGATNSTTTVPVGIRPFAVAVNPLTNKIYVANLGAVLAKFVGGSVSVIDGATNSTTTIVTYPADTPPRAVAVNPATNMVYVAYSSNVTVIDGATNSTTTVTDPNAMSPVAIAVNPITNKIYVANKGNMPFGGNPGSITVIDGHTNSTTTVADPNAISPDSVAVNPVTNMIYVANEGDYPGANHGNITVIDGATNSTTTLTDPETLAPGGGSLGFAVAVNSETNKIYVTNANTSALTENGGITVIDGATNSISHVTDPNAIGPVAVAVDPATNQIYVANEGSLIFSGSNPGSITVIDGATNSITTVVDPNANAPVAVAVDSVTDRIYVGNVGSGNVTVIDGAGTPDDFTLSLTAAGNGTGTVTSNPAGIDCPVACSASFASGAAVTLTATPASGSGFTGWSGACAGTGACSITMNADESVTANFSLIDFSLGAASANLSVQPGAQASEVITVTPQNGAFSSAVQLSCAVSGPSPKPTCALSPTSVTPGANPATSTLTISAPASTIVAPVLRRQFPAPPFAAWPMLAMLGFTFVMRFKKNLRRCWAASSLLMLLLVLHSACGGGSVVKKPPVNYAVSITGTSGALVHTTQITVTVP
jgi:DNA-binding beta-propeller fold protein YncE